MKPDKVRMRIHLAGLLMETDEDTRCVGVRLAKNLGIYSEDWYGTVWTPINDARYLREPNPDEVGWQVTEVGLRFLESGDG